MLNEARPVRGATTVLLVEDDPTVAQTIAAIVESGGHRVWHAESGADARAMLEQVHPDLIILDLGLPDVDGLVLCSTLKAMADVPIIICSAAPRGPNAALGLKLGADDFIPKPFDLGEFEARVEAVLRRTRVSRSAAPPPAAAPATGQIRLGELVIDRSRRRVSLGGQALQLTPTEYRLLSALAGRPDELLTREELAQLVWGYQDVTSGRTIDVHMRALRAKLAGGPVPPPSIITVRGFGYRITAETGARR